MTMRETRLVLLVPESASDGNLLRPDVASHLSKAEDEALATERGSVLQKVVFNLKKRFFNFKSND